MTQAKAAILNSSVLEWWFENRTILNPNSKTFGFRMDSEFECSVFQPPLQYIFSSPVEVQFVNAVVFFNQSLIFVVQANLSIIMYKTKGPTISILEFQSFTIYYFNIHNMHIKEIQSMNCIKIVTFKQPIYNKESYVCRILVKLIW